MRNKINLVFEDGGLKRLPIAANIKTCINAVLKQEGVPVKCEINVLVTDDKGIRTINRTARNIDKPTDVLSFPMFQLEAGNPPQDWSGYLDPETGMCPLGDMAISMEHVAAQAKEFGHSNRRELCYLVVHSVLHLLGYDHLDEGPQKQQMRAREEAILAELGITREE